MHPTFKIFEKILLFLRLAGPIVLTQFSLIAGSFVASYYPVNTAPCISPGYL